MLTGISVLAPSSSHYIPIEGFQRTICLTCFPSGLLTCALRRGVHLCLRLRQRVLEPQIFLDVHLEIPRHFAVHFLWCAAEAEWRAQCGVFILLFLLGITLTRILFWSIRATVNITIRSPRSGISSTNIRPPCKKLVHSRSVEGAAGSMRRGFTLLFYGACQLDSGEAQ